MEILRLENITKHFGSNAVVKELNLSIRKGEFLTILGPSGCGKTTTLRMIAGFETPDTGRILLNGKDITSLPPYQRQVNTVFQNYALFPNMSVEQNVAYGLKQQKKSKKEIDSRVSEMLDMVRMKSFAKRKPQELSGGQQQRIAIARAVACDPDILLLDEPLGALDLKLRKQMQLELKQLQKSLNKTFVYVTHDQEEALTMSDRIAVMNNGNMDQLEDCHGIYYKPKTKFVADFIGEANILKGVIDDKGYLQVNSMRFPLEANSISNGQPAVMYIRPEHISISQNVDDATIQGRR
jgi:spermidine/putrescine transport system ATP-binding protein